MADRIIGMTTIARAGRQSPEIHDSQSLAIGWMSAVSAKAKKPRV
ncbi:hypothetical protein [Dongia sp.]